VSHLFNPPLGDIKVLPEARTSGGGDSATGGKVPRPGGGREDLALDERRGSSGTGAKCQ
jgi:hypothetical protein